MLATLFDTETSGLIANGTMKLDKQPEIIEFYACVADLATGEIHREFETLIKPFRPLSLERKPGEGKTTTEVTGITNEMLVDAPCFAQVADCIAEILIEAPVVIAHNLSFDYELVNLEFFRLRRTIPWPETHICTVEQTIWLKGYRLNMGALYELLFDETFVDAHRAKPDTMAMLRIAVELLKRDMI